MPAVEVESSSDTIDSFEPTALIAPQAEAADLSFDIPAGTLEMVKEYVVYPGDTLEDVARTQCECRGYFAGESVALEGTPLQVYHSHTHC